MLGLGLTERRRRRPDPAAAALIARMDVAPGAARASLIDAAVRALKAGGVWAKLDCLYLMAAHDGQAAALNWIGSGNTLAAVGSLPAFTQDRGFQGDGSSQLLSTGFIPGSGKLLQDDHHFSIWCLTNSQLGVSEFGADTVTILTRNGSDQMATRSASPTNDIGASSDSRGLFLVSRAGPAGYSRYVRGVPADSPSQASSAFGGSHALYLCGRNNSGIPNYSTKQLAAATLGGALSHAEQAALHGALAAYLAALGAV